MSTEPKKLPPRIHKAPKRFGDEQDNPSPAKKNKNVAESAEKSTRTTLEKQTRKDTQQSTLKFQKPKPKPMIARPFAPTQKRITSVDSEIEEVNDPADRQESEPTRDLTQILERTDGSDDESEKQDQEDDDIIIIDEPTESAEMELSLYEFFQLPSIDLLNHRSGIK